MAYESWASNVLMAVSVNLLVPILGLGALILGVDATHQVLFPLRSRQVLLSCDDRMFSAFTGVSKVRVRQPSEFWESLGIPTGSTPVRCPAPGHPLFGKTWWRIGDA